MSDLDISSSLGTEVKARYVQEAYRALAHVWSVWPAANQIDIPVTEVTSRDETAMWRHTSVPGITIKVHAFEFGDALFDSAHAHLVHDASRFGQVIPSDVPYSPLFDFALTDRVRSTMLRPGVQMAYVAAIDRLGEQAHLAGQKAARELLGTVCTLRQDPWVGSVTVSLAEPSESDDDGKRAEELLSMVRESPIEPGEPHDAETLVAGRLEENPSRFLQWLETDATIAASPSMRASLIQLLGRVASESSKVRASVRVTMAHALESDSVQVRDAVVLALERIGGKKELSILANHTEPTAWLSAYIQRVLHRRQLK